MTTTQTVNLPGVGERITERGQFEQLPEGTVINTPDLSDPAFVKRGDHFTARWGAEESRTSSHPLRMFEDGAWVIQALPEVEVVGTPSEPEVTVEEPIEGQETFQQYVERFRTTVLASAQTNGKDVDPIKDAFIEMGLPTPERTVGMVFDGGDEEFWDALPYGTIIENPAPVTHPVTVERAFKQESGTWHDLRAEWDLEYGTLYAIVYLPGHTTPAAWTQGFGTAEDRRRIEEFNARALEIGARLKRSEDWCDQYETTMRVRFDLDPEVEPEMEEVTVDVSITGTLSVYMDDEMAERVGGPVRVDMSRIDIEWSASAAFDFEVEEGTCACDRVDSARLQEWLEGEGVSFDDFEFETECSND